MLYSVVSDDVYSNGCFDLKTNWLLSDFISSGEENTGYIVQNIQRWVVASSQFMDTIKNDINSYQHEYFEAWKIENGTIKLEADYGFHDQWTYMMGGYYGMVQDYANKYKTSGTLKMVGKVYWINKNAPEYTVVEQSFKKGKVKYAKELISSYDFDEAKHLKYKCYREKKGSWDFENNKKYIEAVIEYTKKGQSSQNKWVDDIGKYFSNIPIWEQLVTAIKAINL